MRISELSHHSGVPVATIKYYLREGLLPAGELTSATQASYDADHLARVRLIRALTVSAGLPVATAGSILAALDAPQARPIDVMGTTHELLGGPAEPADTGPVVELLDELGWDATAARPSSTAALAHALAGVAAAGFEIPPGVLHRYGEAMAMVAEIELANAPDTSAEAAVRYVVLGTVMMEPVLLALRRLAQNDAAVRRFVPTGPGQEPDRPGVP